MKVIIQSDIGNTLQEFIIPEGTTFITEEQAISMGKNIAKSLNELIPEVEEYEKLLLKNCTCYWKTLPEPKRKYNRTHSSECGVWEMEK